MVLLRVPYEMKAGDAATVGGLPPSAFMLAVPGGANSAAAPASPARSASARRLPDSQQGEKRSASQCEATMGRWSQPMARALFELNPDRRTPIAERRTPNAF